jgi:chromosome segregation ATPase
METPTPSASRGGNIQFCTFFFCREYIHFEIYLPVVSVGCFFQQELSRGKAEAVKLLQQEMQQKLLNLETEMSDKLQSSELTNKQLEAEVKVLRQQVEEQDQANRELELKLKSLQGKGSSGKTLINSEGDSELEVVINEFKNKLQVAETKLAEKENVIAELEASSKLLADEHDKNLLSLKLKVEEATTSRLHTESKLSEKDQEIKELKNIHKQQLEEGQKMVAEMQSQLQLESTKKCEAENKCVELLNQIGSVSLQNKDAELMSSEIVSLKEKARDLELKLNEATEECRKVGREKESLGSVVVGSFKAVSLLKQSLQALRADVYDRLNCVKEEVNKVGSQVMDIFYWTKREVEIVRKELQERDDIHTNLRKNLSALEEELHEQEANVKCGRKLEGMLEDLRLSKNNLETELSENNALIRKLQHELQNMKTTLERKEQETFELNDNITDLQKELGEKMERAYEDMVNLRNGYEIKLQSKDTEISELKKTHDESCSKFVSLESVLNIAESKLKTVSDDYKNLELKNEELDGKVKELEDHCHSQKTEFVVLIEERERLAGTIEELTCALTEYKREADVHNEKIRRLTDSLTDAGNETTTLRVEIENISGELLKASKDKQTLEGQIAEIEDVKLKVIENLKSQEAVWKSKSDSDEIQIKTLEAALQSLQRELTYEKQQFECEISSLSSQLEQSQQKERALSAQAEIVKEENTKLKGDRSSLKSELEQTQERVQLLSAEIERMSNESTGQGHLLKDKEAELEIAAAEKEAILAKCGIESAKILEAERKLNALNEERGKWLKQQALLETKEEDLKQLNIKLEQLQVEAQETKFLKDECKSVKESNDCLKKQVEQFISMVDSLENTSKDNYEIIEQLKAEKTALENAINVTVTQENELRDAVQSLQAEVSQLKSHNEILTSEREDKTQQLKKLEKELQESILEKSRIEEIGLDLDKILIERSNLEERLENLSDEKKILEEQLNCEENIRKEKQQEERLEAEVLHVKIEELQKALYSALKEKVDLEQTLTASCGNLQIAREADQRRYLFDISEVRKQLEDTLLEKTALEHRLSTEIEKARGIQDLDKLLVEREQLEHRLDNTLVDLQEKEKQVAELEDIHAEKIKQLVHDFEKQLAQRDERLTDLENEKCGKYWRRVTFQYRLPIKHIRCF